MAQNRSYDPPISSPPSEPPRTIKQVDTNTEHSDWGATARVVPTPYGGIALQRSIAGKSDGPVR